ncbi:DUF4344 domain-containing metallopeptidase [Devosia nitrariae]|nr:DUF4344 domain-containing metallopeptidase [Devosia nitrariae]
MTHLSLMPAFTVAALTAIAACGPTIAAPPADAARPLLLAQADDSQPEAADGSGLTDEQTQRALETVLNITQFVIIHEMGHMMVGEFDLPVLGHSEDAADNFASVVLLAEFPDDANDTLRDAMKGWFLLGAAQFDNDNDDDDFSLYYDEHTLSISRGYEILCLMVGSDEDTFGPLADEYGVDEDRKQSCAFDYGLAAEGWFTLLAPHTRDSQDSDAAAASDGDDGTDDQQAALTVSYEEPGEELAGAHDMLANSGLLEGLADLITSNYAMPRPIEVTARACGTANADYNWQNAEIEICYEFIDMLADLVASDAMQNPDDYTVATAAPGMEIDLNALVDDWTVTAVESDPEMEISAIVEDDPSYMDAGLSISGDAMTWTSEPDGGTFDDCADPDLSPRDDGGYDVTCDGEPWGPEAVLTAIDPDTISLTWYDGAILTLSRDSARSGARGQGAPPSPLWGGKRDRI